MARVLYCIRIELEKGNTGQDISDTSDGVRCEGNILDVTVPEGPWFGRKVCGSPASGLLLHS